MGSQHRKRRGGQGPLFSLCFYLACLCSASAQLSYSVSEELSPGSIVGNIAKDLDLTAQRIVQRNLRVVPDSPTQYFEVNQATGDLVIKQQIDREQLCELSPACSLTLQMLLENPLEMLRVVVEILDVNDNAPHFTTTNISLDISEAASPGTRFRLESAHDPDVGTNSLRTYHLAANDLFILNVETKSDGSKFPELVVDKPLDRETQASFRLLLTAVDGGQPEKSGSTLLLIKILDVNDNAPVFDEPVKKVTLLENVAPGTLVTKLNATDSDSGSNGEVSFLFSKYTPPRVLEHFTVDAKNGEIRVKRDVDYEKATSYHITIQARDGGSPAMEGSCNVIVDIIDVNDNAPEVTLTSPISPIREDAAPDTVIALLSARDLDSGPNGKVTLTVQQGLPFKLSATFGTHYRLTTARALDRETVPEYTVVIKATDAGSPPLTSQTTFVVKLTDVNDNAPTFSQSSYSVDIPENNAPSAPITIVTATDPDLGENAKVSYSILPSMIQGSPISSYVYINPESGHIFSMRSLDHEQLNAFRIEVQAQDAGVPPRTANVTVHVFVVDVNDNAPMLVHPSYPKDKGLQLSVPPSAGPGHLITKLVAVDADSGHNAWLFYSIAPGPHVGMFRIAAHSGELRIAHKWAEEEAGLSYHITVVIQDNGDPPKSTSVNITVTVDEKSLVNDAPVVPRHKPFYHHSGMPNITLYLIISLACVSGVSFITFVVLMVRCLRHRSPGLGGSDCCCFEQRSSRYHQRPSKDLHLQLNTDGPIRYMEVVGGPQEPHTRTYRPCYSTLSSRSDFVFMKTPMLSHNNTLNMTLSRQHLMNSQKPPQNDWRFTQGQRPGPSGPHMPYGTQIRWTPKSGTRATGGPEVAMGTGPWPQPPTEAEQLQALMAAANAVNEATATLGPGTMGLSTRYSPQFTLQHVPDYRQNVYIPGSTATLTSNPQQQQATAQQATQQALPPPQVSAQPEPPKAAQTPASKKKSTKKEKK
ncbi:protocadherin gamma-C5-like isoform X2 [Periophthalmus magnuspinnatus]|uniref:protocadherin gamma-C5-like isoform X2 n=1 Tax=Periophthalmus magnuspinnatus TaxID=409849 RepID=UPI00145ADD15|nr:protocadherin gamma-C5-like isoform X2 [Periophthalmus magnuspinnatus]